MRFSHSVSLSFLVYLPALHTAPDPHPGAHLKAGSKTRVASPADAGYVIGFAIRAVHSQQDICDLPAQRSFSVNWRLADIAVQEYLIGLV